MKSLNTKKGKLKIDKLTITKLTNDQKNSIKAGSIMFDTPSLNGHDAPTI